VSETASIMYIGTANILQNFVKFISWTFTYFY